jgi:hypothetical protein
VDRQCKVNGIRVDLQEITSNLLNCAGVANGHVCTRQTPGGTRLAAFVTPERDATPHPADIRAKLAVDLPRYCVPHDVTVIVALPTTMSGKVDEAALIDLLTHGGTGEAGGTGVVDEVIARCTGTAEAGGDPVSLQTLTSLEMIGIRQGTGSRPPRRAIRWCACGTRPGTGRVRTPKCWTTSTHASSKSSTTPAKRTYRTR